MEYPVSDRVRSITPSATLAISAQAKKLRAEGRDVIGFGAGEPDFDTPDHIKAACVAALEAGFTKYTPSSGIPELRQAIADKLLRDQGVAYETSQIIVNCGGKHSCFNVMMAMLNAGDEALIPAPYWLSYPEMVRLAGGTPVVLDTSDANDFKITPEQLEAATTERTKLLILNSPSNPTGTVYTPDEIRALAAVCEAKNLWILSDEIYEKLLYENATHLSPASISDTMRERVILVHGLAKAYSMTGWRIGFTAAPAPIAKAIDALQSHSTSNPTSFAQKGAIAALTGPQDHLDVWLRAFDERRRYAIEALNQTPGIRCSNAQGAFYLFPNISGIGLSSSDFCAQLLAEEGVAAVPGIAFGAEGYIRLSYATDLDTIKEGLQRLTRFAAKKTS